MNHLERLIHSIGNYVFVILLIQSLVLLGGIWIAQTAFGLEVTTTAAGAGVGALLLAFVLALISSRVLSEPIKLLWQAILHVSPAQSETAPPNLQNARLGRELVTSLALQVYQLASASGKPAPSSSDSRLQTLINSLPLPTLILDKNDNVLAANEALAQYAQLTPQPGNNFYSLMDLAFPSDHTFDSWLSECRNNKVTDRYSWERVRWNRPDKQPALQFDMAAYYNKGGLGDGEVIVTLFDHTDRYSQEDDQLGFVALAVHELRTPLTTLRGYIEVFEEELDGKLDDELADFMRKMQASAQQLASFVNNILNVSRIEDNQLTLQLTEEKWDSVLQNACDDMRLRAQVHKKTIELTLPAVLPPVAVDRVSIYEVISNLLDNAIKYSGEGQKKIMIKVVVRKDGLVETSVQDSGIGIAESILPNLFEKFYRNHRTRGQVGGTGLGLYLSKSIIKAHGGDIWVRSKEGEGTTFGFTIQPYASLTDEQKNSDTAIVRSAHGWIKNHSLYRR